MEQITDLQSLVPVTTYKNERKKAIRTQLIKKFSARLFQCKKFIVYHGKLPSATITPPMSGPEREVKRHLLEKWKVSCLQLYPFLLLWLSLSTPRFSTPLPGLPIQHSCSQRTFFVRTCVRSLAAKVLVYMLLPPGEYIQRYIPLSITILPSVRLRD